MCDLPGGRRRHPQGRSQRARLPGWCVGVENVGGLLALSAFSCTLRAAFVSSREIRCTVTGSRHISRNFSLRQSKAYFSKDFEKSTFAPNAVVLRFAFPRVCCAKLSLNDKFCGHIAKSYCSHDILSTLVSNVADQLGPKVAKAIDSENAWWCWWC